MLTPTYKRNTIEEGQNECSKTDWGNELTLAVSFLNTDLDDLPRWSENYDGFEVDADFSRTWDFQPAMRHLTLKSAKPTEEAEQ